MLSTQPEITIITPTYNQAPFIEDTLKSVLAQKLGRKLQYLILDNNSTDGTDKVVKKFLPKFRKQGVDVAYIRQTDTGQSNAINQGLTRAKGTILGYLNSDDYFEDTVLSEVIAYFHKTKCSWAYGGWNYVDEKKMLFKHVSPPPYHHDVLLSYDYIGQPACFFTARAFKKIGNFNESLHYTMDYDYWLRLATHFTPGVIPHTIANLRCHTSSKSSQQATKQFISSFKLAATYSSQFSILRLKQYAYLLIALSLAITKLDIANRAAKKIKLPLIDF